MKRIFSVLFLVAVGAMGPGAASEPAVEPPSSDVTELSDSIVVTANRVGMSAGESVWPVVVVGPANLKAAGELESAIDGRAGLDIRNYNGFGSLSTMSSWGVFARHALLLYNGRVVKDYSLGGFNLSDFSASEIERVEILKGPQSAFYGADAVGGVINLITRSSLSNKVDLSVKRGTHSYGEYDLHVSRRLGKIGISGQAQYAASNNSRSNAGSERTVFSLRSDYLSTDGKHRLAVSARYFNDSLGAPGPKPAEKYIPVYGDYESSSLYDHQTDENYSADLQYRFSEETIGDFQFDLFWEKKNLVYNSLYSYQLDYYTHDDPVAPVDSQYNVDSVDVTGHSVYNKRSLGITGRYIRNIHNLQVAGGVDYLSGSIRGTTYDVTAGTNIVGPFAPYEYGYDTYSFWKGGQDQFDLWSNVIAGAESGPQVDVSGRLQFVKGRQTQPSYNVGLIVPVEAWLRWKIGYAYAFRLPSIAEQFAEEVLIAGNDDINPETSRSIQSSLALTCPGGRLSARWTVFHQTVDSLIQYQMDPGTYLYIPQNVDRFKSTGLDIDLGYRHSGQLLFSWSGVIQKAQQTYYGGEDYVDAFYVPDFKWRFDLSGECQRFTYGANLSYTSDRSKIVSGNTKIIEQVYEFGISLGVTVTPGLSISLSGHDLTDQARPDQFGFSIFDGDYPSPGRRFIVGLRYGLR
ncbi:MAG: TonB-dependent receptor plug domain-containing protein [Candidatus Zixiibacteriota bacterium]|nr:MAG: TonB-dependent receptor plug domain-containing protein [candidate division Zixibacteria bacterium]